MSKDKNERISKSCKSNVKDGQDLLHIWKDQFGGTSNSKKKSTDHPFQIATYRLESFLSFFIEED